MSCPSCLSPQALWSTPTQAGSGHQCSAPATCLGSSPSHPHPGDKVATLCFWALPKTSPSPSAPLPPPVFTGGRKKPTRLNVVRFHAMITGQVGRTGAGCLNYFLNPGSKFRPHHHPGTAQRPGTQTLKPYPFLAVCSWANDLTSLCLGSPTCKMGFINIPSSQGWESIRTRPGTQRGLYKLH